MPTFAVLAALASAACGAPVRVGAPCSSGPAFAPFDEPAPAAAGPDEPDGLLDSLVAWYQRDGRAPALAGVGCPFAPTCSSYARSALHRYGPLGLVLIVDRLIVREHALAAAYYPTICVAHTTRLVDVLP